MRAHEFISEKTPQEMGIHQIIDIADNYLSGDAAKAIDKFIGHGPGTVDRKTDNHGMGIWSQDSIESGEYSNELERAFKSVREELRKVLGDSVKLYRVQLDVPDDAPTRKYLSWSSDSKFSKHYSGHQKVKDLFSDEDIKKAEKVFDETGEVKIPNTRYILKADIITVPNTEEDYQHINRVFPAGQWRVNGDVIEIDSIDIYDSTDGHLTDTDSVEKFMTGINADRQETIDANKKSSEKVITRNINLNDVIWVSDRAGQSEFIVSNDPSSSGYIDI